MTTKRGHRRTGVATLGGLAVLALIVAAGWPAPAAAQGQSGTTLSATKTATGFNEQRIVYDWTVDKSVDPTTLQFDQVGDMHTVTYTIGATRNETSKDIKIGVRGEICVTNGGAVTTENLKLVDQVQYKTGSGMFQSLPGASQTIQPAQLGPGEMKCYNYEITFTPINGAQYKNTVHVTITNHSGHTDPPTEFGPEPKADFSLPTQTIVETDESAQVEEEEICPDGFTCEEIDTGDGTGSFDFNESGSVSFDKKITWDDSAECGSVVVLPNTVTLTESDSEEEHQSGAEVEITTADCQDGACTRTIGYWKTAPHVDALADLLPIELYPYFNVTSVTQAQTILGIPNPSDAKDKLKAQLLAALLNIKAGADGSAVTATIADAQAYLKGTKVLTKTQVLALKDVLDAYNNGLIGPGHCGDDTTQ